MDGWKRLWWFGKKIKLGDHELHNVCGEKTLLDTCSAPGTKQDTAPTFMNSTHYHCPKCLGEIKYLGCDRYRVRVIGICWDCGKIMVEYLSEKPLWLEMEGTVQNG